VLGAGVVAGAVAGALEVAGAERVAEPVFSVAVDGLLATLRSPLVANHAMPPMIRIATRTPNIHPPLPEPMPIDERR
jgi:hypothetical protein